MKKKFLLVLSMVFSVFLSHGQSSSVTNNTIIIQGNVYYFQPATTPSSPQPRVGSSNFISYGRWYGADAAKAWASIADWAIEHCEAAGSPVKGRNGERVYISSVEARKSNYQDSNHVIVIYYWIVVAGAQMEDGRRETRTFFFK
jgi:hypothetical protein